MVRLEKVSISIGVFKADFKPTLEERDAAWRMMVDLGTSIATQPFTIETGHLRDALDSLHRIFKAIKDELKAIRPSTFATDWIGLTDSDRDALKTLAPVAPQAAMPSSMALKSAGQATAPASGDSNPLRANITPLMAGSSQNSNGYVDASGFYQAPNITYAIGEGTIRDEPVKAQIMSNLSNVVSSLGDEYGLVVVSGGQPATGSDRTGSHRHDHGNAVDFYLTRDGARVNPGDDKPLYEELISRSAPYFSGIGHYSWGIHVGGGTEAFWGPDTTSATADPDFKQAFYNARK